MLTILTIIMISVNAAKYSDGLLVFTGLLDCANCLLGALMHYHYLKYSEQRNK